MNPFLRQPNDHCSEALELLADAERAYRLRNRLGMLGEFDWTVSDPQAGSTSRIEVPETVRSWVVTGYCYVFAEWLLSGPEPFEERLGKYATLSEWAEREPVGKFAMPDGYGILHMAHIRYLEFTQSCLAGPYVTTLFPQHRWIGAEALDHLPVVEGCVEVLARLLGFAMSLTPQEAWRGLGLETQKDAANGEEVRNKRAAYAYTRDHFPEWVDQAPTAAQGAVLVERMRELAPTMSADEYEAMSTHGVDLAIEVPEPIWLQIRAALDDEFELRLTRGLFPTLSVN